jgi:predicted CoA-binding protein
MAVAEGPARIDLMSVDRSTANTVLVRFRMANQGQEEIWIQGNLNHSEALARYDAAGVTLIDARRTTSVTSR